MFKLFGKHITLLKNHSSNKDDSENQIGSVPTIQFETSTKDACYTYFIGEKSSTDINPVVKIKCDSLSVMKSYLKNIHYDPDKDYYLRIYFSNQEYTPWLPICFSAEDKKVSLFNIDVT